MLVKFFFVKIYFFHIDMCYWGHTGKSYNMLYAGKITTVMLSKPARSFRLFWNVSTLHLVNLWTLVSLKLCNLPRPKQPGLGSLQTMPTEFSSSYTFFHSWRRLIWNVYVPIWHFLTGRKTDSYLAAPCRCNLNRRICTVTNLWKSEEYAINRLVTDVKHMRYKRWR